MSSRNSFALLNQPKRAHSKKPKAEAPAAAAPQKKEAPTKTVEVIASTTVTAAYNDPSFEQVQARTRPTKTARPEGARAPKDGARGGAKGPRPSRPRQPKAEGQVAQEGQQTSEKPRRRRDDSKPDRTYDRHSGTGQGKEMKKEGHGRRNWGGAGDEAATERRPRPNRQRLPKVEAEVPAPKAEEVKPAEGEAAAAQPADAKPDARKEEEDEDAKLKTLADYQKEIAANILGPKSSRKVSKVEDAKWKAAKKLEDNENEYLKLSDAKKAEKKPAEKKSEKKAEAPKQKQLSFIEFMKDHETKRKQNKGNNQYSRGSSSSSAAPPKMADFPALGKPKAVKQAAQ